MNNQFRHNIYRLSRELDERHVVPYGHAWDYGRKHALPLWMEFTQLSRWERNSKFIHFRPNNVSFEIPLRGDISITVDDVTKVIKPGEALILPRGVYNQLKTGPSGYCWKLSCGVCGALTERLLAILRLSYDEISLIEDTAEYVDLLMEIGRLLEKRNKSDVPKIAGMTYEFLARLSQPHTADINPYVANAIRVMNFNISRNITVGEIADELGITREKLNRLFKKEMGVTVKQRLIQIRMDNAECLLQSGNQTIKNIAFALGYSSPQKFCNEFTKRHNMSPRKYREQRGNE